MKTRLNKKNNTVTLTLNFDELWMLRTMAFDSWMKNTDDGFNNIANEAMAFREKTNKAYAYISSNLEIQ